MGNKGVNEIDKKAVESKIKEWYRVATVMDLDLFMELAADEFVLLNPGRKAITGKEEFRKFFYEYGGKPMGPVTLGESYIDVSESGDMAYQYGTHNHVIWDDGDKSQVSVWKQLIVLKKINGVWKIIAMSETNLN